MKNVFIFLIAATALLGQTVTPVSTAAIPPLVTPILTLSITGTSAEGISVYGQLTGTSAFITTDFLVSPNGNLIALMSDKTAPVAGYTARYVAGWIPAPNSGITQPPLLIVHTED